MPVEDLGLGVFVDGFRKFGKQMAEMSKSIDRLADEWEDSDKSSRKAAKGMDVVAKSAKKTSKVQEILTGALRRVGEKAIEFIKNLPRMVVELVKMGGAAQRQSNSLDNLAKAAGTSGREIVSAIQGASDFTIDRMTAMAAANKAMLLDVAKSPEQFEKLTKVAVRLGRAMGLDAAKSIDDFVVAAGRQSIMIADNLGLTIKAGEANKAYAKKLGIAVKEMTTAERKQAFLNAMLEAGEAKMGELGDGGLDAAGDMERLTAALSDLKTATAETIATQTRGIVSTAADAAARAVQIRQVARLEEELIKLGALREEESFTTVEATRRLEAHSLTGVKTAAVFRDVNEAYEAYNEQLHAAQEATAQATWEMEEWETGSWAAEKSTVALTEAQKEGALALSATRAEMLEFTEGSEEWIQSQDDAQIATAALAQEELLLQAGLQAAAEGAEELAAGSEELTISLTEAQVAAIEMGNAVLDMGMDWKTFFEDVEKSALDFAEKREEAESEHLENLAGLQEKARSKAIWLDVAAEDEKLAKLKEKLDLALLQQSEFGEKTKESTRVAKQNQIDTLTEQVAEQETLLGDYYAGRLVTQGKNIDSELAAEKVRYEDELLLLEAEQAKQEEAQRQSLGRMILQSFDAWATMKQIPADRMLEMRLAISEEYGLIDTDARETAEAMIDSWETWADDTSLSADRAIAAFDNITLATRDLKVSIDAIPRTIDIEARFRGPGAETLGPGLTFQRGTMYVPRTGLALLHKGEAVLPQHVATILRQRAGNVTNNITNEGNQNEFNLNTNTNMQPGQMALEFSTFAMATR